MSVVIVVLVSEFFCLLAQKGKSENDLLHSREVGRCWDLPPTV